ncbi:MAG: bifunctional adenosylcobinamide kinase/adenosylcobinamide-phosphate guanylyltransferase [Bacillota bacterium]|jgi:adenosylcobinamide kinase/adenosylcobinamide-phosphate guanylyltransferase
MKKIIFITGGARSGKSTFAEQLASQKGEEVLYLATAVASDEEMRERIARHRAQRPSSWQTIEAYEKLADMLEKASQRVVLIDCLTVMINNLLYPKWHDKMNYQEQQQLEFQITQEIQDLLDADFKGTLIIVSNELGMGLVPSSALGRYFRDLAGRINQQVADRANEVYLLVSGIPVQIK